MSQAEKVKSLFDQMAESYDQQWKNMQPLRDTLNLLVGAACDQVEKDAKVLCVGAGTGLEVIYLAQRFPGWTFTAVDPSEAMLEVCEANMKAAGIQDRCTLHVGYVESLPDEKNYSVATSFLVSQFILVERERINFFQQIARRLKAGGIFFNSEISTDKNSGSYDKELLLWLNMRRGGGASSEELENMRAAYDRDIALSSVADIEGMLTRAGFRSPLEIFRASLLCAWVSQT